MVETGATNPSAGTSHCEFYGAHSRKPSPWHSFTHLLNYILFTTSLYVVYKLLPSMIVPS